MMKVIVADSTRDRGKRMASVLFGEVSETYYHDARQLSTGGGEWTRRADRPERVDLLLVHNNDLPRQDRNESTEEEKLFEKIRGSAGSVVLYTGGQPGRTDSAAKVWWIHRGINGEREVLTSKEAKELVEWVKGGADPDRVPSVLVHVKTREDLEALAILCQGFLAVHAERKTGSLRSGLDSLTDEKVEQALERMGWSAAFGSGQSKDERIPVVSREQMEDVSKASWWDVFGGEPSIGDELAGLGSAHVEPIRKLCAQIWPSEVSVDGSADAGKAKRVSIRLVAEAYLAISDVLEANGGA